MDSQQQYTTVSEIAARLEMPLIGSFTRGRLRTQLMQSERWEIEGEVEGQYHDVQGTWVVTAIYHPDPSRWRFYLRPEPEGGADCFTFLRVDRLHL
jgi:hypothetical protein